jgi:hypothetical protein
MSHTTTPITNNMDLIDSRDVIARIRYLNIGYLDAPGIKCDEADIEDLEELKALTALAEEASGSPDWKYGEALIRDSYFQDYARELAEDCGMLKDSNTWPGRCIDWDKAVKELQYDYISVDFGGIDYWIRA